MSTDVLQVHDLENRVFYAFDDNKEAGQVQLIDVMPRISPTGRSIDYAIPQMARVSYGTGTKKVNEDTGLIRYLMRHRHDSPFEAITFKFRIRCPIFVYRQWFRHRSGDQCEMEVISTDENVRKYTSMNEYSARYSIVPDVWYIPQELRMQSATNKQGGEAILDTGLNQAAHNQINLAMQASRTAYESMIQSGVSRELARAVLPVSYVTEFYLVTNLLNTLRWIALRIDEHAQLEIRRFAQIIASMIRELCPISFAAFQDYVLNARTFTQEQLSLLMDRNKKWDPNNTFMSLREYEEFLRKKLEIDAYIPFLHTLKNNSDLIREESNGNNS